MALVRVPFYFINLLPTSLLYISILLTAAQGGRAFVAAGEGGEYLQTQCRADKRLPQRLIPSIIGGRGPEGPEP